MQLEQAQNEAALSRTGSRAAACTLVGALLSGPLALVVVGSTHPQPRWLGVDVFVEHHHAIQALPFFLGFLLVGGFLALVASLHAVARAEHRARTAAGLGFAAAFAALVVLNYALQTTVVPVLVREQRGPADAFLAVITMSNPSSLGWALEMWGYGLLGVATWLVAPVFDRSRLERATSWAFKANAPMSIGPALWTALDPGWELTVPGMIGFALWNLLVVAMAVGAMAAFRARRRGPSTLPTSVRVRGPCASSS